MPAVYLNYAKGQMNLSKHAQKNCLFALGGGDFTGYYRFVRTFYRLAGMHPICQQKTDKTVDLEQPIISHTGKCRKKRRTDTIRITECRLPC